jgi:predicted ATPase
MAVLARAYLKDKQKESALALIAYALNVAERTGERLLESELYLLKGEALLLEAGNATHKEAEAMFRKASQLADTFGQDFSALRAAISMYQLCKRGERGPEARAELQQVYNRFTEGFEIADMKRARELLQEE